MIFSKRGASPLLNSPLKKGVKGETLEGGERSL
jgi:hypothetical protein